MEISERIQQLRKAAGYSQEKLAELLHVSRQAISKWESGATLPTIDNLTELSKIFHVSISELLQGQEADKDHTAEAAAYDQKKTEEDNLISLESLKLILHENEERILRKDRRFRNILAGLGFVFVAIIILLVFFLNICRIQILCYSRVLFQ
jgi:transcriptional regulator with XRE-family HTH domain